MNVMRWRRRLLGAGLTGLLAVVGAAGAEAWTVQTVAVRDYREARERVEALLEMGFDAYTEFTTAEGVQWVRVRVGCFATRAGAEALAASLSDEITSEAVPVERSVEGANRLCVRREVGFRADEWSQVASGAPAFRVVVDGVEALVRLRQGRWQLLQGGALDALPVAESGGHEHFEQAEGPDGPWVRHRAGGHELYVCPGRLLAEEGAAAVVEHDGVVMACHVASEEP